MWAIDLCRDPRADPRKGRRRSTRGGSSLQWAVGHKACPWTRKWRWGRHLIGRSAFCFRYSSRGCNFSAIYPGCWMHVAALKTQRLVSSPSGRIDRHQGARRRVRLTLETILALNLPPGIACEKWLPFSERAARSATSLSKSLPLGASLFD